MSSEYEALWAAIGRLEVEHARYRDALEHIRDGCGRVCGEFETCDHVACRSSHEAWAIAAGALGGSGGNIASQERRIDGRG
jgi:hypothetical protein